MRTPIAQQFGFGDGFIDPSLYELDEELRKVDELLCQSSLLKPFEEVFDESLGRLCLQSLAAEMNNGGKDCSFSETKRRM